MDASRVKHFDSSEIVQINGLALIKMLKHALSGVPKEVSGVLIGKRIDLYKISVIDVYPFSEYSHRSGDNNDYYLPDEYNDNDFIHPFNEPILYDIRKGEEKLGWFKSHPGTDVWLSNVDVKNQFDIEKDEPRAICIVIDPIQSIKGRIIIGAYRSYESSSSNEEARQTTSFVGHMDRPSIKALVRNLNKTYYSLPIKIKMTEGEQKVLACLMRSYWSSAFGIKSFVSNDEKSLKHIKSLIDIMPSLKASIKEDEKLDKVQFKIRHVGKVNPKEKIVDISRIIASTEYDRLIRIYLNKSYFIAD